MSSVNSFKATGAQRGRSNYPWWWINTRGCLGNFNKSEDPRIAPPPAPEFLDAPIITILAEEVKSPEKNIPKGIAFSFLILVIANVAANFSYYTVLSREEALTSDAVAMLFGERIHPILPVVLAILVCLCAIGTLNVAIMGQPRMLLAAGRNGHMPKIMTMLHRKFNTPWPATITMGCVAMVMLATGSIMSLMATTSLYAGIMVCLLLMCFFTLRWKRPDARRPWKVPLLLPILGSILTAILVVLSLVEKFRELSVVVLVVVLGSPVYFLCVKLQKPEQLFNYLDKLGFYLQLSLNLSYEDT